MICDFANATHFSWADQGQHSSLLQHIFNVIERNFSSVKIKCVLLQNRFHEKEAIEKDAFVPYSKEENPDNSLLKTWNQGWMDGSAFL